MNLPRALRIAATGVAFALFGSGGLLFALVAFPLTYVLTPKRVHRRVFRAQVAWLFRTFIHTVKGVGLITYRVEGLREILPGTLVIANHPSLIDVIFLLGWLEGANCVVKHALLRNPFTFGPLKAAGYIDNQHPDFADLVWQALADGERVVLFPEGTRSVPGRPLRFQRGAAHCALRGGYPLHPVVITVTPPTLSKREAWWQVPDRTPNFVVRAHPPWPTKPYESMGTPGQQARRLTGDLLKFYQTTLASASG